MPVSGTTIDVLSKICNHNCDLDKIQASQSSNPRHQVYASPLAGGGRAVVLFNRHNQEYPFNNITVTWEQLGYAMDEPALVRDLFAEEDLGTFTGTIPRCSDCSAPNTLIVAVHRVPISSCRHRGLEEFKRK